MGLNDIQLSSTLLSDLYTDSIVLSSVTETLEPAPTIRPKINKEESDGFKFLGSNLRQTLILVNYTEAVYLPDEELSFLTNLLTACKLTLGDVAVVNKNSYPESEASVLENFFGPNKTILFGISPAAYGLPANFPEFQVQALAGTTYLHAPTLEKISADKNLKLKLWQSLQVLFELKK